MGQAEIDVASATPVSRPVSKKGQLEYLLRQLSHQELSRFVLEAALRDASFHESFMVTYADLLSPTQSEQDANGELRHRKRLSKILQQYTNQDGFISHRNARGVCSAITALLEAARRATTPVNESVDLALALMTLMPDLGDKMDDAEECFYALMELNCTVLLECFDSLKPAAAQLCFERIVLIYAEPAYLDLDLDNFLLVLLKDWSRGNKSRQSACLRQQEQMLKQCDNDPWRKNYLLEQTRDLLKHWQQ